MSDLEILVHDRKSRAFASSPIGRLRGLLKPAWTFRGSSKILKVLKLTRPTKVRLSFYSRRRDLHLHSCINPGQHCGEKRAKLRTIVGSGSGLPGRGKVRIGSCSTHGKCEAGFRELIEHLRSDIDKVDEPQFKAMFETTAEVLGGLEKAFEDYERKNESAWER